MTSVEHSPARCDALAAQIIRDLKVLAEPADCHIPSTAFYLQRVRLFKQTYNLLRGVKKS